MTTFHLASEPFVPGDAQRELTDATAGACVTFEGWVRNHNEHRHVVGLEYEAYAPLAEKEGARVLEEAMAKFAIIKVRCVHRVGRLRPGDMAVWVGVTAAHRDAAFEACRYVIDEVKARVPIWKKEHYADGATEWINCAIRGNYVGESRSSV